MVLRLLKCVTQETWQNSRDKLRLASPERIVGDSEIEPFVEACLFNLRFARHSTIIFKRCS